MNYTVSERRRADGYTFADVHDADGKHVGRIVKAGGTWGPDAALKKAIGHGGRWQSYEAAKAELEGS